MEWTLKANAACSVLARNKRLFRKGEVGTGLCSECPSLNRSVCPTAKNYRNRPLQIIACTFLDNDLTRFLPPLLQFQPLLMLMVCLRHDKRFDPHATVVLGAVHCCAWISGHCFCFVWFNRKANDNTAIHRMNNENDIFLVSPIIWMELLVRKLVHAKKYCFRKSIHNCRRELIQLHGGQQVNNVQRSANRCHCRVYPNCFASSPSFPLAVKDLLKLTWSCQRWVTH